MTDEKAVAQLKIHLNECDGPCDCVIDFEDIVMTLDLLWVVARSVRRWEDATQGKPSIEAKQNLDKAMAAVGLKWH